MIRIDCQDIFAKFFFRETIEQFCSYISMDVMVRLYSLMRWTYISISMYNKLNSIFVCEGTICWECVKEYKVMLQFFFKNIDKRIRRDINIIATYGVLNQ